MTKGQIVLVVVALALALLLFQLPKSVVENERVAEVADTVHTMNRPVVVAAKISRLKSYWKRAENTRKKTKFADSLAVLYLDYQMIDSAIWFIESMNRSETDQGEYRAAELYYTAFRRAPSREKAKEIGDQAGKMLEDLLEQDPENSSLKVMLGMTMVTTENPMQGVQMLRDVVAKDPENREAILNLGILSLQSGQYAKAEERFSRLLDLNPADQEALFYRGLSLIELRDPEGRRIMEVLFTESENPAIKELAKGYLD